MTPLRHTWCWVPFFTTPALPTSEQLAHNVEGRKDLSPLPCSDIGSSKKHAQPSAETLEGAGGCMNTLNSLHIAFRSRSDFSSHRFKLLASKFHRGMTNLNGPHLTGHRPEQSKRYTCRLHRATSALSNSDLPHHTALSCHSNLFTAVRLLTCSTNSTAIYTYYRP